LASMVSPALTLARCAQNLAGPAKPSTDTSLRQGSSVPMGKGPRHWPMTPPSEIHALSFRKWQHNKSTRLALKPQINVTGDARNEEFGIKSFPGIFQGSFYRCLDVVLTSWAAFGFPPVNLVRPCPRVF